MTDEERPLPEPTHTAAGDDSAARFPRSAAYDSAWQDENLMGPNVLWLTEFVAEAMTLRPGMRVLDLGCGRAISSIFLAREFGVQVWATDLWIPASENQRRIVAAGVSERVVPIHAEAHTLPFAEGFFDAIVSVDAYHYFGTDDLYLGEALRFLVPDGQIGIAVPGVTTEIDEQPPEHVRPYWQWELCSLHGPAWWRRHWQKTGLVDVQVADWLADGWRVWLRWAELYARRTGAAAEEAEVAMLRADGGRLFGIARVVARRRGLPLPP
jgi:cyclopropane fatty-acyl-phospholipid synthase-like methyltransferase